MAWENSTRRSRLPAGWEALRLVVLARDDQLCRIGLPGCTVVATEVDHIVPGDDHSMTNLQAACVHCNAEKNYSERPRQAPLRRPREAHPGLL